MPEYKQGSEEKSQYEHKYRKDYESDWDLHRQYIQNFDAYEAMVIGVVYDSVSSKVDGSKITDSYATTLSRDRADRVIAKLPDGETVSVGRADVGKALFMDLLRQKWIYPNANSQRPFLEKLNLWQFYSSVYGYMLMFYDWTTSSTGYVGPDCWLWNPRNFIPQQGKVSIEDMDYCHALTWVSKKRLQNILDKEEPDDGWNRDALQELVNRVDTKTAGNDTEQDTFVERDRVPGGSKKGICLATRYEAGPDGEWCTFAPDNGFIEVRKLKNPHKNGRIPFVCKYGQPLFDSFYGLGDFQRAKPLQFARDGLTNFYFANLKRNLAPGIIVNANGVVKHTLDVTKANPVLMETIPNSIRPMPTNTAGLSTYQAAQSNLTGSLLSLYGTQNASIPGAEALNPSQGKTPAAIADYSDKEATRDGAERRHLETAIEQLTDGFFSLVANIGTEDIPIDLFYDDIKEIVRSGSEDVLGLFNGKLKMDETETAGTLTIKPSALKGVEYRFNIARDSTRKVNKEKQLLALERFLGNIGKFQNIFKDDPRIDVHADKIAQAFAALADIKGGDEFVTFKEGPSPQEEMLQQQVQQLQQELEAAQQPQQRPVSESLSYKDAPEDIKRQIEQQAGLQPSQMFSPAATEQALKHSTIIANEQQNQNAEAQLLQGVRQNPSKSASLKDPYLASAAEHVNNL